MFLSYLRRERLHKADDSWGWKLTFRVLAAIFAIVGVGCIGWALATAGLPYAKLRSASHYVSDMDAVPWVMIPLTISILFNVLVALILLVLVRPVPPAVAIAFDLILWLGFFVTGIFLTAAAGESLNWHATEWYNDNQTIPAHWEYANHTRVYIPEQGPRPCSGFANCAEQKSFTDQTHYRAKVEIVAGAATWIVFILHFVTFCWACIDEHRRRQAQRELHIQQVAQHIVADMSERGLGPSTPGLPLISNSAAVGRNDSDRSLPMQPPEVHAQTSAPVRPTFYYG